MKLSAVKRRLGNYYQQLFIEQIEANTLLIYCLRLPIYINKNVSVNQ